MAKLGPNALNRFLFGWLLLTASSSTHSPLASSVTTDTMGEILLFGRFPMTNYYKIPQSALEGRRRETEGNIIGSFDPCSCFICPRGDDSICLWKYNQRTTIYYHSVRPTDRPTDPPPFSHPPADFLPRQRNGRKMVIYFDNFSRSILRRRQDLLLATMSDEQEQRNSDEEVEEEQEYKQIIPKQSPPLKVDTRTMPGAPTSADLVNLLPLSPADSQVDTLRRGRGSVGMKNSNF